jgi:ornithine carbamoyltransferase
MRHFISLLDYSSEELTDILDRADYMAKAWQENRMPANLVNEQVGLWFYGQGFRNRVAFDIGLQAMGAKVCYIPGELGIHEPIEDIGQYLSNWFTLLVIRAKSQEDLLYLAETSTIPVINARTDISHPCEIMGDLQFLRQYRGSLKELKLVFVGEVTNICMSWFEAAVKFPISVIQVAPEGYEADKELLEKLNQNAVGSISTTNALEEVINHADVIYTDCWPGADNAEEKERIRKAFLPYQITEKHLRSLSKQGVFLPCPPVTRGQEVSCNAMESEWCKNFQDKNYLLHSQNAIAEMIVHCNK